MFKNSLLAVISIICLFYSIIFFALGKLCNNTDIVLYKISFLIAPVSLILFIFSIKGFLKAKKSRNGLTNGN